MPSPAGKSPEVIAASDAVKDDKRDLAQHQAFVNWLQAHLIDSPGAQVAWLDLGCGKGQVLFAIEKNLDPDKRARIRYVGVDGSEEHTRATLERARVCLLNSPTVHHADLRDLGLVGNQAFDLVTFINTCHELSPRSVASVLFQAIERLGAKGKLWAYDMEQLPENQLELGALTWSRAEIQLLATALVGPLRPAPDAVVTGGWHHSSCDGWHLWVHRSLLNPPRPLGELREACLAAAAEATEQILQRRRSSVRSVLESLTMHSAGTAAEQVDKLRALHDLWALDRAGNVK